GARVFTVEDGWGWLFVAVEHWNAECMGWHVCKQGTRFAALEPISQGLMTTVGSVAADAGRGLALRLDHGTQYLSDHFQNQLTLGDQPRLRLYRATSDQWRGRTLHPDNERAGCLWSGVSES
ncbi:MAG: hypothetical protein WAU47_10055, partial [Desulfobaccales bacterium]